MDPGGRGARDLRVDAPRARPVDRHRRHPAVRVAGGVREGPVVRPRRARGAAGARVAVRGGAARPPARERIHRAALGGSVLPRIRAAVRRRRRGDVLAGVRDPVQLHRGRLPALHARGDRQHPRVLPGAVDRRRDRCRRVAHRARRAPCAPPRRSRADVACPPARIRRRRAGAAGRRAGRRQHRADGSDRQCVRRRARRKRDLHVRGRRAAQRARLRQAVRDDAAGRGGQAAQVARRRAQAAPAEPSLDQVAAREGAEPHIPGMPRRPRHVILVTVESLSAEFLGAYGRRRA